MTCLEKYRQEHPDVSLECILTTMCPNHGGGINIPDPDYCPEDNGQPGCVTCWNRQIPGTEKHPGLQAAKEKLQEEVIANVMGAMKNLTRTIKDSGTRQEFSTGAVRDIQKGKGRCDLMPLDVISEITADSVLRYIAEFTEKGVRAFLSYALDNFSGYTNYPDMLLEVSKHFEEGAEKYGENNWQKGLPVKCYINSAVRHYLKYLRGDTDEPHDRAFVWNIICAMWTCKHKPELNNYAMVECPVCGEPLPAEAKFCDNCMVSQDFDPDSLMGEYEEENV